MAWATCPGSYAERVRVPAASVMVVPPEGTDWDVAATVPLQGMTAHFLATDSYALGPDDRCLVHAGAGGVGLLLIQIAKLLGAEVFTTVGSPAEGRTRGRGRGRPHDPLQRRRRSPTAVREIAGEERPLDVVYDGVGKSVFQRQPRADPACAG